MSSTGQLKNQVMHSLKWVALGRVTTQMVRWAITFWVIRLLTPEDYGIVAMADAFFGMLQLVIGSVFVPSLVQTKDLTKEAIKKIFGGIVILHVSIFLLQLALAGFIGDYYNSNDVTRVLQVNAWIFLITAFQIIPSSLLTRELRFKAQSIIGAVSNIAAALSTLYLAYQGYGFWSLIVGELISIVLRTILVCVVNPAFYLPDFRIWQIGDVLKFGGLAVAHSLLFYVFLHMDVAIAGRYMSPEEIGLFALGLQFALMPQKKILPILKSVAFPAFSKIQHQPELMQSGVLKSQRISALAILPIFWGLAAIVDQLIPQLLGDRWSNAILPVTIVLIAMPLRFLDELYFPAFTSQRKMTHLLTNTSISIVIMGAAIFMAMQYGATGLAFAWLLGFPFAYLINAWRNCRELGIGFMHMHAQFVPTYFSGITMVASIYLAKQWLDELTIVNLIAQTMIGGLVFLASLYLSGKKLMLEAVSLVKTKT